jgi:hypothetical protein
LGDNELLYAKGIFPYEWFDSMNKTRLRLTAVERRILQQVERRGHFGGICEA